MSPTLSTWHKLGPQVEQSGLGSAKPRAERGLARDLGKLLKLAALHVSFL